MKQKQNINHPQTGKHTSEEIAKVLVEITKGDEHEKRK